MAERYSGHDIRAAARMSRKVAGEYTRLSPNFYVYELACRDGTEIFLVHPALLVLLEEIRSYFKRPVIVTSGYRTKTHNSRVGGKPDSAHLYGVAADIRIIGTPPFDVQTFAEKLGVGGLGSYDTWTHVDVIGKDRRWDE